MQLAIIGAGNVGDALATGSLRVGYSIALRNPGAVP
jgi:pyrroline-5-carboxylate reductase